MSDWVPLPEGYSWAVYPGKCENILPYFPDNYADSLIVDPPYGIKFMNKKWDYQVPSVETWKANLRILKPGAYGLVFCGTRTQHRMVVNLEDAGFEVVDVIGWVYSQGMPKGKNFRGEWEGWSTALKPAMELITIVRKPFSGTFEKNLETWGVGALNISATRIAHASEDDLKESKAKNPGRSDKVTSNVLGSNRPQQSVNDSGRWPANLIHDGSQEVLDLFPESKSGVPGIRRKPHETNSMAGTLALTGETETGYGDSGSAARFFYCAKATKQDKNEGLTDQENQHPTVKPTSLMQYLCKLVTPPSGVVVDTMCGSGSTGKAARLEGFRFVGIDESEENVGIARHRIQAVEGVDRSETHF